VIVDPWTLAIWWRGLLEMYVADERFTWYSDDVEPGLAQFVRDIVVASIES
jgi:MerR family transcriptional regulator, thiopeptide resistance regulator